MIADFLSKIFYLLGFVLTSCAGGNLKLAVLRVENENLVDENIDIIQGCNFAIFLVGMNSVAKSLRGNLFNKYGIGIMNTHISYRLVAEQSVEWLIASGTSPVFAIDYVRASRPSFFHFTYFLIHGADGLVVPLFAMINIPDTQVPDCAITRVSKVCREKGWTEHLMATYSRIDDHTSDKFKLELISAKDGIFIYRKGFCGATTNESSSLVVVELPIRAFNGGTLKFYSEERVKLSDEQGPIQTLQGTLGDPLFSKFGFDSFFIRGHYTLLEEQVVGKMYQVVKFEFGPFKFSLDPTFLSILDAGEIANYIFPLKHRRRISERGVMRHNNNISPIKPSSFNLSISENRVIGMASSGKLPFTIILFKNDIPVRVVENFLQKEFPMSDFDAIMVVSFGWLSPVSDFLHHFGGANNFLSNVEDLPAYMDDPNLLLYVKI